MSLDTLVKHLSGKHPQKRHTPKSGKTAPKGNKKGSGGGSGLMSGLEAIAGRKFNPDAAERKAGRTSNLMNVSVPSGTRPSAMQKQFDAFFQEQGMKKVPGRTKNETVYGNSDQSNVARLKKRSVKIGGTTHHSFLLELIT